MVSRDVALNELPMRGLAINADADNTNSFVLVGSDSGIIFINKETGTGVITYSLPSLVAGTGKIYWFYNAQTTQEIAITAPSDCMIGNTNTYTTLTTTSNDIGDSAFVTCDGTSYYFFAIAGTWSGS